MSYSERPGTERPGTERGGEVQTRSLDSIPARVENNEREVRETVTRKIEKVLPRNARKDN